MAPRRSLRKLTLPAYYVRQIADEIRSMGVDLGHWLRLSGLDETQLADPALHISHATFQRLFLSAVTMAREPALGLFVGERLVGSTHGIVGYAMLNSGTLREALGLLQHYMPLRMPLVALSMQSQRSEVRVCVTATCPLEELERTLLEAVILSVKNLLDTSSMGVADVQYVAFPFPAPRYASLARQFFRCEVRYAQAWAGFALPTRTLDVPLRLADPAAFREAARICQQELDKLSASDSTASRVRRLLLEKQTGFPSLEVTARHFHVTPRTLHRRLAEEGTSFRELLEEVRHTLAVEHLRSGRFSVEEVAYTLGYSDTANFRRAFKRWEAVSPAAYRTSQQHSLH
ncbi:MAG: hypothetical protein QG601_1152 [Pseudomonadota bacterium]|jgi:AraC-like DNA-binding protein|nr:hypothetical protein [Pseudomonadota bacterium]MDQ1309882.1 hypothetical protein [Pseudomonadota bacterium]MDQ1342066.1 hypothetical protein [Pseudomonadota bacterium]